MKYQNITHDDMLNGDGLRTVLWVSGCNHHCKGCQNPVTWNPEDGLPFDETAKRELLSYLDADYCSGLTLSGGDPMYPDNRAEVLALVKEFRKRYGNRKSIWMYTGYEYRDIQGHPILDYVDVLVDGEYIEDKRNTARLWCGSDNQIVWQRHGATWVALPKEYQKSISEAGGCNGNNS